VIFEYFSAKDWLEGIRQRYNIQKTTLNDSKEAFTIMYLPFYPKYNGSLLIGRFDRNRQYGVVICRRIRDIQVEYDKRGNK